MGTPERLKMLCLLTYADIKAVNPEALTPWKAENIWQLYIGTANYMLRSVDERLHVDEDDEVLAHLRTLAPGGGKKLESFLEGLPRRYLRTQAASEIISQMEMANHLGEDPVQLALTRGRHWYELTLVTLDRPFLFAKMAGTLAAWGMNIVKAAAFSNQRRNRRGHISFHRPLPHAGVESARMGAIQDKHPRCSARQGGPRSHAARPDAQRKRTSRRR